MSWLMQNLNELLTRKYENSHYLVLCSCTFLYCCPEVETNQTRVVSSTNLIQINKTFVDFGRTINTKFCEQFREYVRIDSYASILSLDDHLIVLLVNLS